MRTWLKHQMIGSTLNSFCNMKDNLKVYKGHDLEIIRYCIKNNLLEFFPFEEIKTK